MQGDSLFERQSYTLEIIADTATSVTEQLSDVPLRIYPNPACSMITIDGIEAHASFTVTDVLALPLLTGTTTGNIDISSLARGSYVLTLMQGGEARTVRFVKE